MPGLLTTCLWACGFANRRAAEVLVAGAAAAGFAGKRAGLRELALSTQRGKETRRGACQPRTRAMSSSNGLERASDKWDGAMSQQELMMKDTCILVDERDRIVGNVSKKTCHTFGGEHPNGMLHRAFSVFLFNENNELLLQKRASDKITFPDVWTNTCCSHPLYGYDPCEVDQPEDVASGQTPGVKHAAVRKLAHELGIPAHQVGIEKFKFLTRLHYCAADSVTWGPNSEWGEHEVDYILLIKAQVDVKPNPEEVGDFKYVKPSELRLMMDSKDLLWSPWFRIIVREFLHSWWDNLDEALTTGRFVDQEVHKLEC
mmetsp:Transcript_4162/g.10694  ORF Transcript_4162/g.10694 Transcript_4162/m.10694 type:complete len:315 (-) Transcript_4162:101-1045(-)